MEFRPRDGEQFADVVQISMPRLIVEVGTWHGASLIAFLGAAKLAGIDSQAIAVDTWLGSVEHWTDQKRGEWSRDQLGIVKGEPTFIDSFRSNLKKFGFANQVEMVRAPSEAGLPYLLASGVQPGLIYIDGDHSFRAVMRDVALAWAFKSSGAEVLVAGDDWGWAPVRRAITISALRVAGEVWSKENMWVLIDKRSPGSLQFRARGWKKHSSFSFPLLAVDTARVRRRLVKVARKFTRTYIDPITSRLPGMG